MRTLYKIADTPLALASAAAITVGAAQLHVAAGWIVGGVVGLYVSWRASSHRGGGEA